MTIATGIILYIVSLVWAYHEVRNIYLNAEVIPKPDWYDIILILSPAINTLVAISLFLIRKSGGKVKIW